ncbi:hypothetical protein OAA09_01450 [bacterium]|nr:hypothetical protein [bacterium]
MAKNQNPTERLLERRSWTLESLKTALAGLTGSISDLEKKISADGITARYSVNSDVLRWARKIHSAEHELSLLHELLVYTEHADGIIEVTNKETADVQEEQEEAGPPEAEKLGRRGCFPPRWSRHSRPEEVQSEDEAQTAAIIDSFV